ncbi:hypothetical protein LJ656_00400 [Paraburkholderia sp. MMS20-SJTR3]|uniref:Cellulose biosynthesis protein BcsR n=1 Tax=Paraburkholderia sejongensis TaxID=2886946 RepID=A0ABS8JMU0_9BURK|nr:hypothetical protein [Paraburkholderia sp. MMS20-SJTR3]MCC8391033.1 hypothetical protein [Paraburkholderia sp. MMS20-SJTR3]
MKTGNAVKDNGRGGWPLDDISGLAQRLPEVEPRRYFDAQAQDAYRQALLKWPVLARLMTLLPADGDEGEGGAPNVAVDVAQGLNETA